MSGTYNAGSDIIVAGQLSGSGGSIIPTGMGNTGTGTITNITQPGSPAAAGVFYVQVVGGTTHNLYVTGTLVSSTPPGSPVVGMRTLPAAGTPATFSFATQGISFTITNGGGGLGGNAFVPGDGFILYIGQQGQNDSLAATQQTGLSVTVQQFVPFSATTPILWGAVIQDMFNYCGANPGVVGIIPPGFYDCSDAYFFDSSNAKHYGLTIVSNMTISAYGAVLSTAQNATGDFGFLTVSDPNAAVNGPTGKIHNVTIMGGTWGSAGVNGAQCSDNSVLYAGTRTGKVISLFVDHDLSLIDVTVRGWSQGLAFYLFCNKNLTVQNGSFWNSDGNMGSGGIRIANGSNILASNSNGISGDDALQFAPSGSSTAQMGSGISNAFFVGGNVQSLAARAFVVTLIAGGKMPDPTYVMNSTIAHVGFIGIVGNIGASSALGCYISNKNGITASTTLPPSSMPMPQPPAIVPPAIQDVTVAGCKLTAPAGGTNTAMISLECAAPFTVTNADMSTTTNYCGPVQDVYFSDTSTTNPASVAVSIAGYYSPTSPGSSTYITIQNINFRACTFYQPLGTTTAGTVAVYNCVGYSFDTCAVYSNASPCFKLGDFATPTAAGKIASLGRINGCTLYTNSTTDPGQSRLIYITNGDMNVISGWSRFFLGSEPVIGGATGSATTVIDIHAAVSGTFASMVTNTLIDEVDMRGVPTTIAPINDAGVNTRAGLNILTPALQPTGALTLAIVRKDLESGATYRWPKFATILSLTSTSTTAVTGVTIYLPPTPNDGEIHTLTAPTANYTSIAFDKNINGVGSSANVSPAFPLQIAWDASNAYWFVI